MQQTRQKKFYDTQGMFAPNEEVEVSRHKSVEPTKKYDFQKHFLKEVNSKKGRKEFNIHDFGRSPPRIEKNLTPILNDFIKNKVKRVYNKKVELLQRETMRDRLDLRAPPTI